MNYSSNRVGRKSQAISNRRSKVYFALSTSPHLLVHYFAKIEYSARLYKATMSKNLGQTKITEENNFHQSLKQ